MTVTAASHRSVRHHPVRHAPVHHAPVHHAPAHHAPVHHPRPHAAGHTRTDSFSSGTARGTPSAARTNEVLNRLDVQHNRKYLPTGARGTSSRVTHCNEFAQTALRQMGVPGPTGNANHMNDWFNRQGPKNGWHAVSAAEAQKMANSGHAVVASWKNTHGVHGHVAIVRPGEAGAGGPRIAQAGGHNYNDASVRQGFGRHTPQYFVHD